MTIEREIEITAQKGSKVEWQAYGLDTIQLDIPPTVYPPREDTALLDRTLAEMEPGINQHLLEIGCGSGALSIASAQRGWVVSACDVNPLAVAATRGNAEKIIPGISLNVREGGPGDIEGWMPKEGVDVIVWNLPYLEPDEGENLGPLEDSGLVNQGGDFDLLAALNDNPTHVNPGGVVLMLHSSNKIGQDISRNWRRAGWATRNISETICGDERLTVVACWRPFEGAMKIRLESCNSTNDEVSNINESIQGTSVSTEMQISGRGQHGRAWRDTPGGLMSSWALDKKSINKGPENLQLAANIAVMDTISCFLGLGLPSHNWVNCSPLEAKGIRIKWPNDIWLRNSERIGKMCGVLVESKSQGEKMDIVLGIGMNRYPVQDFDESMGWDELFSESIEELLPVIHASISSLLEIHNRIPDFSHETIMHTVYASMRCTLCETSFDAFGLDSHGGLLTKKNSILTTEELEWVWR